MSNADGHTKQNYKINWHSIIFFIPSADVLSQILKNKSH